MSSVTARMTGRYTGYPALMAGRSLVWIAPGLDVFAVLR